MSGCRLIAVSRAAPGIRTLITQVLNLVPLPLGQSGRACLAGTPVSRCRCSARAARVVVSFASPRCSYYLWRRVVRAARVAALFVVPVSLVSWCCSCRRNGRARTCGLPVPGRMLFLLSYAPSRVRAGWRGPNRTRRGPADRAGVATPLAQSQSHAPLPRGQSRSGGSNPVLPGGSRLPYRFGLCGVSPGISRGESFRALQGEGMNGFAFNVCCAVDLSRAGNGLPLAVGYYLVSEMKKPPGRVSLAAGRFPS